MLLSKTVELKWNAKIKKHYVSLGYKFTKMGDTFIVKVNDLTKCSSVKVDVICDYCGRVYKKYWYRYLEENDNTTIHKDCCNKCKKHKIMETSIAKYGVNTVFKLEDVKQKIANTNIEKYGVENPFASEIIKERIIETNMERYGVPNPLKSEEILEKTKQTCIKKYGVPFYVQLIPSQIGELSPRWKGGVAHHRIERATFEYNNWRKSVFNRDMYTCQCCRDKSSKGHSVKLCAHHIKNWKDYPNERYNIDNGITLCESCHLTFHSEYGKNKNTLEQLNKFLSIHGKKIC